jgi:D-ribose pyranose/furanose isomerase RbsD
MIVEKPSQQHEVSEGKEAKSSTIQRDVLTSNGQDTLTPLRATGWEKLDFESSVEMLAVVDPNIREINKETGKPNVILHKWQVEESERICLANPKPTSITPYKYALCAANGSGKDAFVIAPFAVWFITCKIRSIVVITSSSGVQLSNQTENYIRSFSEKVNSWAREVYGQDIIKVRRRHITCLLSGSEIFLFATDEEGKAEGYHPVEPNAEMAIIVNEAKTVPPEIFRALRRCTGYNYWINVSTPGAPVGDFYDSVANPETMWPHTRKITYYDCPHQAPSEFEYDKKVLGEHSPLFLSKWLAEFSFAEGKFVINNLALQRMRNLNRNKKVKVIKQDWPIRVGCDIALSGQGDETAAYAFRGNKQLDKVVFRSADPADVVTRLEDFFIKLKLSFDHNYIFMDGGGVGKAVVMMLRRKGWSIRVVHNQSASNNKKSFRNKGAELWHKISRLVEACGLIIEDDEKLYKQLATRKYKELDSGIDRLQIESKPAMKEKGFPSPDRADALVLAFTDVNIGEMLDSIEIIEEEKPIKRKLTQAEIEDRIYAGLFNEQQKKRASTHSGYRLSKILKQKHQPRGLLR